MSTMRLLSEEFPDAHLINVKFIHVPFDWECLTPDYRATRIFEHIRVLNRLEKISLFAPFLGYRIAEIDMHSENFVQAMSYLAFREVIGSNLQWVLLTEKNVALIRPERDIPLYQQLETEWVL